VGPRSLELRYRRARARVFSAGLLLILSSPLIADESLVDLMKLNSASAPVCIGCDGYRDRMRVLFRWEDTQADLDLHIFRPTGPGGSERVELYYDRSGDDDFPQFGRLKCDDVGEPTKCKTRGEYFVLPGGLKLTDDKSHDWPYCFTVHFFGDRNPTRKKGSIKWQLTFSIDGAAFQVCSGSDDVFMPAPPKLVPPQNMSPALQRCMADFANSRWETGVGSMVPRQWSGIISFQPLAADVAKNASRLQSTSDIKCEKP
jgi:hypothetical protein